MPPPNSIFFKPARRGAYAIDKKRTGLTQQPQQIASVDSSQQGTETSPEMSASGSQDPGVVPATPTRAEIEGADQELPEEEHNDSQRKNLLIERKDVEINALYRDLEAKDVSIRELEDQVSKLRRDRDADRKQAKNAEAMSKMKEGEQNDKIRKLTDIVDDRGDGFNRAIEYQKQLKEKALELSESVQSQNMDMRDKLNVLRDELETLKTENEALHQAQDDAELGEAIAKELAEQHSEAAAAFEMISQTLEPIMARLGEDFTAENVLKYVEDLQDKVNQAKSIRRDPSNLSIQSSDSGIIVPKTRSGSTLARKASIADELKDLDQEGIESGDEDGRIAGIPEEDEEILQDLPELTNGDLKNEPDDVLRLSSASSMARAVSHSQITPENVKLEDVKPEPSGVVANQQTVSKTRGFFKHDNQRDDISKVLPARKVSEQTTHRKSSSISEVANTKSESEIVKDLLAILDSTEKKLEQAEARALATSSAQMNGKQVRATNDFAKDRRHVIRQTTIVDILHRSPWWTNALFALMILTWALSIFSNWHERRLWLDANNTYELMNHYRPAVLDSLTGVGGGLYG